VRTGLTPEPGATAWRASADLVAAALVSLLALAMAMLQLPFPLRLLVGIAAALILPGYVLSMALFLPGELEGVERAALAFCLSLGLVVLMAPFLNLTPDRLSTGTVTGSVTAVTLLASFAAWWRRRSRLDPKDGSARSWRDYAQGRGVDLRWVALIVALIVVLLVALLSGGLGAKPPAATEFFVLGPGGTGKVLPTRIIAGSPTTITVGISSDEPSASQYTVVLETARARLASRGPITVESGSTWTGPIKFIISTPGNGQEVRVLLWKGSDPQPYRSLRLIVDVVAAR
jgi:uncharacterized membrane protein